MLKGCGDRRGLAFSQFNYARARADETAYAAAIDVAAEIDNPTLLTWSLLNRATLLVETGRRDGEPIEMIDRAIDLARQHELATVLAIALMRKVSAQQHGHQPTQATTTPYEQLLTEATMLVNDPCDQWLADRTHPAASPHPSARTTRQRRRPVPHRGPRPRSRRTLRTVARRGDQPRRESGPARWRRARHGGRAVLARTCVTPWLSSGTARTRPATGRPARAALESPGSAGVVAMQNGGYCGHSCGCRASARPPRRGRTTVRGRDAGCRRS